MDYTEEQLGEAFEKLPEDIQAAIADAETEKKINVIGQRHNLHVDQIGQLADETGLVMLGLKHPDKFVTNLAGRLSIAPTEAETIAGEINTEVFADIREAIKNIADGIASPSDGIAVPVEKVFEQKVSQVFTPASPIKPQKPWEQDPYLANPDQIT